MRTVESHLKRRNGLKRTDYVQFAVVEDPQPETRTELMILAPEGLSGTVAIDLGVVATWPRV